MKFFQFLIPCLFLIGCGKVSNANLGGTWVAESININGQPAEIDFSQIQLKFDGKGGYNFHSTLNYKESGFYQTSGNFLFTIDTLNQGSTEKKVEILDFTGVTLKLKMKGSTGIQEEEQIISFLKK